MEFSIFAAVLCDKVWNARNSAFHLGTLIEPRRLLSSINEATIDHLKTLARLGRGDTSNFSSSNRLPQWLNPRPGRIRVFVDVAFKNNGGAAGMVVQNNASQILKLATQCFKADSPLEAELLALKFSMEFCAALN